MRRSAISAPVAVSEFFSRRIAFLSPDAKFASKMWSPGQLAQGHKYRSFDPIGLFCRELAGVFFCV